MTEEPAYPVEHFATEVMEVCDQHRRKKLEPHLMLAGLSSATIYVMAQTDAQTDRATFIKYLEHLHKDELRRANVYWDAKEARR